MNENEYDISPIKQQKTYLRIVEKIIGMVASGKLQYNDTLYTETDLMNLLSVSRPTLREALRVLEFLGIVSVSPRRGISLNSPKDSVRYLPLIYILMFDKTTNIELFELRRALQVEMVGIAAEYASAEDIMVLTAIVEQMKKQINADYATFAQLDYDFHMQIVHCSKNHLCAKLMETLGTLIRRQLEDRIKNMLINQREGTINYHQQICEALINRDSLRARSIMEEHLRHPSREDHSEPVYFNFNNLLELS
jgi:GntR family transcriptional repressor for pyruvate dehydrogenase complex